MNKSLLLLSVMILSSIVALAQVGTIKGPVGLSDSSPAEFANVLLHRSSDSALVKGAITDEKGMYAFEDIPAGQYYVVASFIGYESIASAPFTLTEAPVELPKLVLQENSIHMDQILVTAKKPFLELKGNNIIVNVASSPTSGGKTAIEILEQSPGIQVNRNSNNISLKGREGVLIMINGKRSFMSRADLVQYLQNLPADVVEKIEILNNPSSKYDAEGNAGIINIVLKKNENLGTNGTLTTGIGYGRTPKYNGGLSLNHKNEKINIYGDYNYSRWQNERVLNILRKIPSDESLSIFDQVNNEDNINHTHRAKLGLDYYLTDKSIIGLLYSTNFGDWHSTGSGQTLLTGNTTEGWDRLRVKTNTVGDWDENTLNFNIQHSFGDQKGALSFDFDLSRFENSREQDIANYFENLEGTELLPANLVRNDPKSTIDIWGLKMDYNNTVLEKIQLETGIKISSVETDNSLDFYSRNSKDSDWSLDQDRSDRFLYKEDIYAGYINTNFELVNFQVEAGLRMESTISSGDSRSLDQVTNRDITNWFPSVSISRQLTPNYKMSASFSQRIDRPNYQNLNPFVYYLDQYTFGKGNPFLSPQYTDSYGLGIEYKQKYFLNLSYSITSDAITEVLLQDEEELATFQTTENLSTVKNFTSSLSLPFTLNEWWSMRANINMYYNKILSPFQEGGQINKDRWTANISLNNSISLPKEWSLEVSSWYNSPSLYGIFEVDHQYALNLGLSKPLFNNKARLSINVNDLLETSLPKINVRQGDIDGIVEPRWEARRINVNFSYNFGNQKIKSRSRKTATDDIKERISKD